MFPENPFLQLTLPRVHAAVARLEEMQWIPEGPVRVAFAGARQDWLAAEQAGKLPYNPVSLPFVWGRLFDQGWFELDIPEWKPGAFLKWMDEAEATLFVNGSPWFGFDVAHRFCRLPEEPSKLHVEGLCLQSGIWHPAATGLSPEGSHLREAALFYRHEEAFRLHMDFLVLLDLLNEELKDVPALQSQETGFGYKAGIDIVPVLIRRVLRGLDDAVNAMDAHGLTAASEKLAEVYAWLKGRNDPIKAVLTGHAHIDLVWLWPERCSEFKAVHTLATMNRLMESYPEFVFGYSQPASYEAIARRSPCLMEKIRERIRSGQIEPVGATYVESDTLMACGEALSRSFALGQKGFRELQGRNSPVLWIPDVFGYAGCLPQIMKGHGVENFFTTKLTWSNINRFPHSSFVWRGTDGTEVLVHVTQGNGYNQAVRASELRDGARAHRQSDIHDQFLAPTGYGDGGGGVTEEMCERARRMADLEGLPAVAWGRIDEFFRHLTPLKPRLPVWQGELYLEYHRGVLTTHGDLKLAFRECERALQIWEAARCASTTQEIPEEPWKRLVFAQFHDYIPGSSIWEVYDEGIAELRSISKSALESASSELAGENGAACLFNPLPLPNIHVLEDGQAVSLPPLSGRRVDELPRLEVKAPVTTSPEAMENAFLRVEFDELGFLGSFTSGGSRVPQSGPLASLVMYPDFPHNFEAWDIDRQTMNLPFPVQSPATSRVEKSTATEGIVSFSRPLGTASKITTRYRLDAFRPILHIEFELDWHEHNQLLKAHFPTAFNGRQARFGAPFGSVLRNQLPGGLRDEAMFESAGSRWMVVGDDGSPGGLAVITEAKYGFSCRDGNIGLSLVRSPRVTGSDRGHARVIPKTLRRMQEAPEFSDQGFHRIRMAISLQDFHTPRELQAAALADLLFTPAIAYQGQETGSGFFGLSGGESVIPCWAKPSADGRGWILRLHEVMGRRDTVRVHLQEGYTASVTDLSEDWEGAKLEGSLEMNPYSLASLRIFKEDV